MASARPTRVPVFATNPTDPEGQLVAPDNARQSEGFTTGTRPPAPLFNWLHNRAGAWLQFHRYLDVMNWLRGTFRVPGFDNDLAIPVGDLIHHGGRWYCAVNVNGTPPGGEDILAGFALLSSEDGVEWQRTSFLSTLQVVSQQVSNEDPFRITACGGRREQFHIVASIRSTNDTLDGGTSPVQRLYSYLPSGIVVHGPGIKDFQWIGYSEYHEQWLFLWKSVSDGTWRFQHHDDPEDVNAFSASGILDTASANGFRPTSIHVNDSGMAVAVGHRNNGADPVIATSPDLIVWTERVVPSGGRVGRNAHYDELDQLWMTGNLGSLDGITWGLLSSPSIGGTNQAHGQIASDGRGMWTQLIEGLTSDLFPRYRCYFSNDRGQTWRFAAEGPVGSGNLGRLAYGSAHWVAVGQGGSSASLRTSDGEAVLASGEPQIPDEGGGVSTSHGDLDDLGEDDHPQYLLRSDQVVLRGAGSPDLILTAPIGFMYQDNVTGHWWRNTDGTNTWEDVTDKPEGVFATSVTINFGESDNPTWTVPCKGLIGNRAVHVSPRYSEEITFVGFSAVASSDDELTITAHTNGVACGDTDVVWDVTQHVVEPTNQPGSDPPVPTLVGESDVESSSTTSLTLDIAALALQADDVVYCQIVTQSSTQVTPPAGQGWTQRYSATEGLRFIWIFSKTWGVTGQSDDTTPTFTRGSAESWGGGLTVFRGSTGLRDGTIGLPGVNINSTTLAIPNSVQHQYPTALRVMFLFSRNTTESHSSANGQVAYWNEAIGTLGRIAAICDTVGETLDVTLSSAIQWHTVTFDLRPDYSLV